MPRNLLSSEIAALGASDVRLEYLFEAEFDTQTLNLWTGLGDEDFGGTIYKGNGWLTVIGNIRETLGAIANGLTVKLTGIPTDLVWLIFNASQGQYKSRIYTAFFNASDIFIGSDLLFEGNMDAVSIDEKHNASVISISYESKLTQLNKTHEIRMADKSHKFKYPGDLGFEKVESIKQQRLFWGRSDTSGVS